MKNNERNYCYCCSTCRRNERLWECVDQWRELRRSIDPSCHEAKPPSRATRPSRLVDHPQSGWLASSTHHNLCCNQFFNQFVYLMMKRKSKLKQTFLGGWRLSGACNRSGNCWWRRRRRRRRSRRRSFSWTSSCRWRHCRLLSGYDRRSCRCSLLWTANTHITVTTHHTN